MTTRRIDGECFERAWIGAVLPALLLLGVLVPWLLLRSGLPDPIAVHFEGGGRADGSMPIGGFLALQLAFALPSAAVLVRAGWRPGSVHPVPVATATFVGVSSTWLWLSVLLANDGQADWHTAELGVGALLGTYGSALGFTLPVLLTVRRHVVRPMPAGPPATVGVALGPDDRVAWFGRSHNRGFLGFGVLNAVVGAGLLALSVSGRVAAATGVSAILVVVGFLLMAFWSVEVRVNGAGLRVRSGVFHWPAVRLPLHEIAWVEAIDLVPTEWGGWGYRGGVRVFGRAAWVLRRGDGLEVTLRDGHRFAVTVDRAAEGAGVLNGLLARPELTESRGS
jgi:hypothetical protein